MPRRQSTPQPPALNAVSGQVLQWKTRARARACGTRGAAGPPPAVCWLYARGRSGQTRRGPGPLWGVWALGCWLRASPPWGHVVSPDPSQSEEWVRGRWPGEVGALPVGPGCSTAYGVVTDDYASPALLQQKWVSLLQGTDTYKLGNLDSSLCKLNKEYVLY